MKELQGSSPHSQLLATGPYPEPVESNPQSPPPANLPKIHSDPILPSMPWPSKWSLPVCWALPPKPCTLFSLPPWLYKDKPHVLYNKVKLMSEGSQKNLNISYHFSALTIHFWQIAQFHAMYDIMCCHVEGQQLLFIRNLYMKCTLHCLDHRNILSHIDCFLFRL
jgi:hypothetical protein